ncbi:uncharacterized protein LOC131258350 [Magnolia sinica]|uniref:uncharacterized protein LOC131258350 n=1 Tax=Magnolia sinica TaxID=86752 RepID=UPI0026583BCE|nr:uncharacterized protein LOC131258350 [Magnolia sinica]
MRIHVTASLPSLLTALVVLSSFLWTIHCQSQTQRTSSGSNRVEEEEGRRFLLSFREIGGNTSFECSPSGPCVACQYSEKNDEKYRCSETGYRIPLKCIEIGGVSKETKSNKFRKRRSVLEDGAKFKSYIHPRVHAALRRLRWRRLLDVSFTSEGGKQTYITYRSCVPAVAEEKLTVLGFEGIMVVLLLVSGLVVYFRRKRTVAMSGVGAVRIPTNSRF